MTCHLLQSGVELPVTRGKSKLSSTRVDIVCNWAGVGQQVPVCIGGFAATVLYCAVQYEEGSGCCMYACTVCMYVCMYVSSVSSLVFGRVCKSVGSSRGMRVSH